MSHARIGRVTMKSGGAEIVPLRLVQVGENFRHDPDAILSAAMGKGFRTLVILGQVEGEDEIWVSGNANAGEGLVLMERAKLQIIGVTE
jgi:hypothetical protein